MNRRTPLPIDPFLKPATEALLRAKSLVLQAEPGAGKTTRFPSALLDVPELGDRQILVLEPRRLAAKLAARRVAEERREQVGRSVGYQFRFEHVGGPGTRLRFLTEGMMLRRLLDDPELERVGAVVLDEFHERHLNTDVALASVRRLQLGPRPDLLLAVMSATLDAQAVADYLGGAPTLFVPGKRFDVSIHYQEQQGSAFREKPLERQIADAVREATAQDDGDVLVFLPGMAEIRRSAQALEGLAESRGLRVLPLHGDLSREEQDAAVSRADRTKVVLATNVAESSLTLEGVRSVVDSGLARKASYSWWSGLPSLHTKPISKASAIQRAGRAGRTQAGRCYRLYSRGDFEARPPFDVAEILRADLSQTLLELKHLGVKNLAEFPWFERPSAQAIESALKLLELLGAGEPEGPITELGRKMVVLPLHPRLARVALEAARLGQGAAGAKLAALLSEVKVESLDLLHNLSSLRTESMRKVEERILASLPPGPTTKLEEEVALQRAVLAGYPDRVSKKRELSSARTGARASHELQLASGGTALVENSSFIASAEYFVTVDAEERKSAGQGGVQVLARALTTLEPDWLLDLPAGWLQETDELAWNASRGCVEQSSRLQYGAIVLSESLGKPTDPKQAALILADNILGRQSTWESLLGSLGRFCDSDRLKALCDRVEFLRENGVSLPPLDLGGLREFLIRSCEGVVSVSEMKDRGDLSDLWVAERSSEEAKLLERLAPTHVQLPSGRRAKIFYERGKPAWVESRLQDFFGLKEGPTVLGGKHRLTIHLLAPNQRAVQVTSDLQGFWERVYPGLRKELGRRYPRHAWPEDPGIPIKIPDKPRR